MQKTVEIWFSHSGFFPELRKLNDSVGVTNIPVQPHVGHVRHTSHHLEEAQIQENTCTRGRKPKSSSWPYPRGRGWEECGKSRHSLDCRVLTPLAMFTVLLLLNPATRQRHWLCCSAGVAD